MRYEKIVLRIRSSWILWGILLLALVWAAGVLVYIARLPNRMSALTEFYLLTAERKAAAYPSELKAGEQGMVLVGIRNLEGEAMDYWLKVTIDGELRQTLGPISLTPEEGWEREVVLTFTWAGEQQNVEFLLYKGEPRSDEKPYRSLFLLVNVR